MCTKHLRMCCMMATIIITRSNLSNLGFFVRFVLIWCASVYKLNTHVVKRTISLKFELETRRATAFELCMYIVAHTDIECSICNHTHVYNQVDMMEVVTNLYAAEIFQSDTQIC